MVDVTVANASDVGKALEDAVAAIGRAAAHYGTGIMITQIGFTSYVVRAHQEVPLGLVRQRKILTRC